MSEQPFDPVARDYDAQFTHTPVGRLQRQRVYHFFKKLLQNESIGRVLEFNCGTGEDACWLAQQGFRVLATDSSPEMIEVARQKASALQLPHTNQPQFQLLALEDTATLEPANPYDLVFSNFGGLNCLAPGALANWARAITLHLRPGGFLLAVVMGRFCLWETVYFLMKRKWRQAWRRRSRGSVPAALRNEQSIDIWYYSPRELVRYLTSDFELIQVRPIGFALPPSYLDTFFRKRPGWLVRLAAMERRLGNWSSLVGMADHYFLLMRKK